MDYFAAAIVIAIALIVLSPLIKGFKRGLGSATGGMICPNCGTQSDPEDVTRGSLGIEIVLWLCFLIPGLIYTIWRHSSKYEACPACHQPGMIPADSPRGKQLAASFSNSAIR